MPKKLFMMGNPEVFGGEAKLQTNVQFYAESPAFFASTIKSKFKPGTYSLADMGSAGGELCTKIVSLLPDYTFEVDAFDVDDKALKRNIVAKHTYHSDLSSVPVDNDKYDISIMRYVLQWNTLEDQAKIIKEVSRITRGIGIIQHCGPDDVSKEEWRKYSDGFINHSGIERIRRKDYFYSSPEDIETLFKSLKISYKRVQYRRIEGYVNIFIERYNLNEEEANKIRPMVGDYNYIMQTAWVIS